MLIGLAPEYWGRGLATEAARAAIRYAFEHRGIEQIWAATDPPNAASVRVLERLGLRFERLVTLQGLEALFYTFGRAELHRLSAPLGA